jgi:hypothetical protein
MIRDELARLIQDGYNALGELEFAESSHGYFLYHSADRNLLSETRVYHSIEDARMIAKYDSSGAYRPLKGAPNLPRGWRIELTNVDELKRALDSFYPGAIGSWLAYQNGKTHPVCLRRTLNREIGMYSGKGKLPVEQRQNLLKKLAAQTADV